MVVNRAMRISKLFAFGCAVGVALLSVAPSFGQVGLFVEHGGASHLVRKVDGTTLMFEQGGQWVRAERKARASLRALPEFLPFVVRR